MDTLPLDGTTSLVCCLTSSDSPEEGWESVRECERKAGREGESEGEREGGRK